MPHDSPMMFNFILHRILLAIKHTNIATKEQRARDGRNQQSTAESAPKLSKTKQHIQAYLDRMDQTRKQDGRRSFKIAEKSIVFCERADPKSTDLLKLISLCM